MLKKYKSCLSCSQKHIKCTGGDPCENCAKKGIKCQYIQKIVQTEVILKQPNLNELHLNHYFQKFLVKHMIRQQTQPEAFKKYNMVNPIINLKHQQDKVPLPKLMFMYCAVALETQNEGNLRLSREFLFKAKGCVPSYAKKLDELFLPSLLMYAGQSFLFTDYESCFQILEMCKLHYPAPIDMVKIVVLEFYVSYLLNREKICMMCHQQILCLLKCLPDDLKKVIAPMTITLDYCIAITTQNHDGINFDRSLTFNENDKPSKKLLSLIEISLFARLTSTVNPKYSNELIKFAGELVRKNSSLLEEFGFQTVLILKNLIETSLVCDSKVIYLELMGLLLKLSNRFPLASNIYSSFFETELVLTNQF
eukprot:gene7151-11464_t